MKSESCSGFPSNDRFIKTKPPSLVYGNGGQCFKREIEYQRNIVFCLGLSAWKAPLHPSFCCRKWAGLPQIAIKPCSGNGTPADALPPIECTAAVLDISLNLFVSWKLNLRRFLTFHTGIPDTMLYICMQCPAALRSTAHPCADLKKYVSCRPTKQHHCALVCFPCSGYRACSCVFSQYSALNNKQTVQISSASLPLPCETDSRCFPQYLPQQLSMELTKPTALRRRKPVFRSHAPTTEHGIDKARCPATQKARFPQYMPQQLSME